MKDYRDSHKHADIPGAYDKKFWDAGTPEGLFWQIEQEILARIVRSLPQPPERSLDFACGTGRVLLWSSDFVKNCTGVDVSSAMLSIARKRNPVAEVVEADITQDKEIVSGPFDLITSFRFFLNAQEELQHEAMAALKRRLDPDGRIVVNFHLNPLSPTGAYVGARSRIGGAIPRSVASLSKAERLLGAHDLEIDKVYGYAYLFYRRPRLMFPKLTAVLERSLSRWNPLPRFASHFVISAKHC